MWILQPLLFREYQLEQLWPRNIILLIRPKCLELEWLLGVEFFQFWAFGKRWKTKFLIFLVPYNCAASGLTAATMCMSFPNSVNVNNLISSANTHASRNNIDPTSNLRGDRVFIFHGSADATVLPGWFRFTCCIYAQNLKHFLWLKRLVGMSKQCTDTLEDKLEANFLLVPHTDS